MNTLSFTDVAHLVVILVVIVASVVLRIENDLDAATVAGILLAALGYATGIQVGKRTG